MAQAIANITPRIEYVAAPGQTVFTVPFPFFENDDVEVYSDGVLQTLTTHYAIVGAGENSGGTVTFVSGRSSGAIVVLLRNISIERLTDFPSTGPFNTENLNADLDRMVAMMQELEEEMGRSFSLDPSVQQATAGVNFNGRPLKNLGAPTEAADAARKSEVDAILPAAAAHEAAALASAGASASSASASAASAAAAQTARLGAEAARDEAEAIVDPEGLIDTLAERLYRKRNRIVNGGIQISQEANGSAVTANLAYPIDQWLLLTQGGAVSAQQVDVGGAEPYRIRLKVTTAKGTLAAGDHLGLRTKIEGFMVADLQWGAAGAETVLLRFLWKGPAGTFCVRVSNIDGGRNWYKKITHAGGEETYEVVVPGDVTGTWNRGGGIGLHLDFIVCSATVAVVADETWNTAGAFSTGGISNGLVSTANEWELGSVGLYLGTEAPLWELPDFAEELQRCQRYYQTIYASIAGISPVIGGVYGSFVSFVTKRDTPTVALMATAVENTNNSTVVAAPVTNTGMRIYGTIAAADVNAVHSAWWSINARL
jgi:hypothetical protein